MHIRSTIQKHLVIARIELKHQRQGYGTKLMKLIDNYCKAKGFVAIEIESVLTKAMNNFCIKHGFELKPDNSGIVDGEIFYGSFIKYL